MNVSVGGKQPVMRDTVWMGRRQSMVVESGSNKGLPKGLKMVTQERHMWRCDMKKQELIDVLSECPDFKQQQNLIELCCKEHGCECLWLPK
jgi:hypothetical protein